MTRQTTLSITNKKARFNYSLEEFMTAGLVLQGTEVKSIRNHQASIAEAYCTFLNGELYIVNMHIAEWKYGSYLNHDPLRKRKLLLEKKQLKKLKMAIETKGFTIVPVKIFLSNRGLIKLEIALAKGKKTEDKREDIKKRDDERQIKNYV
jgi:SsrA-binding protein